MESGRSYRIDALKGIAIIAVVLYHFGGDCPKTKMNVHRN